ncbi:zinc ribbon domain-containing protein [Okeania sp. SIO2B3]|uniref:zinc ribbon domain-containing protein n=1 Tax=Okeania sp. SIO2B3 TaxID=2607784 RepID=UPI00344141E3
MIKVDPKGTSQHCWECLNRVSKSLSERWHSCPRCGQELDRDYNSATPLAPLPGGRAVSFSRKTEKEIDRWV